MAHFKNVITSTLEYFIFMLFGCCTLLLTLIFILASTPMYIYRIFVTKLVSSVTFLRPADLSHKVSVLGTSMAFELSGPQVPCHRPRQTIVVNIIMEGDIIPFEEITKHIRDSWINAKDIDGNLLYPEFQQYIESWLGFMFWKWEKSFQLSDHINLHTIPSNSKISSEQFLCNLMENLLNKRFIPESSPWDVHLIQNYKVTNGQQVYEAAFILRIHHGMGDGFSILNTLMNGMCATKGLNEWKQKFYSNFKPKTSLKYQVYESIRRPFRILYDMGYLASFYLRPTTQWHITDSKKSWYQMYQRSNLIPISKVKQIKCKNSVSFTAVLLSCLSAGLSKMTQTENNLDSIVFSTFLPVPGHSKKLRNEFTGTCFDLPVDPKLDSITRLNVCETSLQNGKSSMIPHLLRFVYAPAALCHVAPVAKLLSHNRTIPVGLTTFQASDLGEVEYNGRKILNCDFCAGAALGVAGIGFMVLSYGDYIRISATAEKSVMTREKVEKLMAYIEDEMNQLNEF